MNPIIAFILGLLVGWLIEWVIDWLYWRKRLQENQLLLTACQEKQKKLEEEITLLKTTHNKEAAPHAETKPGVVLPDRETGTVLPQQSDKLQQIKGIGPVIEKKLNEAGVYTFEQLASKNAQYLREVLGETIERLADEDTIIQQAQQFAEQKQTKGE